MTAEMRESLELLQMPLPELCKKVEEAVMENPVLEYDEDYHPEDNEFSDCALDDNGESYQDDKTALELAKMLTSDGYSFKSGKTYNGDDENFDPYTTLSTEITFTASLLEQLGEMKIDKTTDRICRYIIEDLNEKGYLGSSIEELTQHLGLPQNRIVRAVEIIQKMHPPGVGASDLKECLILQLKQCTNCNTVVIQEIIEEHIELLAVNKIQVIANNLHISVEVAQKCCDFIRNLNPIPSRGFQTDSNEIYVIPEAVIKSDGQGGFLIQSNDSATPHLRINNFYQQMMHEENDKETLEYLKNKVRRAASLMKELSNRESTLSCILKKIVELQKPYFENGVKCLNPMSIAEVADQLGLHESTVSRAISGKHILCLFGTISIKSLFTSKIRAQEGGDVFSSSQIKQSIRTLIELEDKSTPLSDQSITQSLQKHGIDISRRTVAKYRDGLMIPIAGKRKVFS